MTSVLKRTLLVAVLTLTVSAPSFAQNDPPKKESRREQLLQKIEEVKHRKLRDVLNLSDEESKKFFETYQPAEMEILGLVKSRKAEEQKLLELTKGDHTDADVDPTIKNIEALNDKIEGRYHQLNDDLKPMLNPRQRAKLLVFEHEFNRRVRERVRQWRENHHGDNPRRPQRRPNAPGKR